MTTVSLQAWKVEQHDFRSWTDRSTQLRALVRYAILAPSGHNAQPWAFHVDRDLLEVWMDRSRALPVVDPTDRELVIGCGAAVHNLRVAALHFGLRPTVQTLPDAGTLELLARITFEPCGAASALEEMQFRALPNRHTNRRPFSARAVSATLVDAWQAAAAAHGARLELVAGDRREEVAGLIAEGNRLQAADPRFRAELSSWLHPNSSRARDGMPGYSHNFSWPTSLLAPLVVKSFNWGRTQAKKDRQLALGAPVLGVFFTAADDRRAWLAAGEALQEVLLLATAEGVSASFLNQPVEVPALRGRLAAALERPDHPQLLVRMGHGPPVRPTPRRAFEDVWR